MNRTWKLGWCCARMGQTCWRSPFIHSRTSGHCIAIRQLRRIFNLTLLPVTYWQQAPAMPSIAAVVRDQVVLLYANGHYLGSFATSSVSGVFVRPASYNFGHPPIATSGKVGLFVGDESSAAFSDFSIYAISSPPALSYV